jgi:hypothetical protein
MQNNPSLGRPYRYEVDEALQALEAAEAHRNEMALKVAREMGHIRGPHFVRRRQPAMRVTRQMALVLLGGAIFVGLMLVLVSEWAVKLLGF